MTEVKKLTTRDKRIEHLRESRAPEWRKAILFYDNEMKPIIKSISDNLFDDRIKKSLRKYLIISCVSLIEDFMIRRARRMIDEYNIDISALVKRDIEILLSEHYQGTRDRLTKGEYITSKRNFADPEVVNSVYTILLKTDFDFNNLEMDFFDAVKKIDWYDPYKYVKGAKSIFLNWKNFMQMFELRNDIVHSMVKITLSDSKLFSMCDNTMNFLDAADFICNPKFKRTVIQRLKSPLTLRQRHALLWKKYRISWRSNI